MAYYSLARAATGAFVRGLAGSVGRRVGNYRRRRRYRATSKATNIRRRRTYVKRGRKVTGSRNIVRLWRAVRQLQRTSDPDVSIKDLLKSPPVLPNDTTAGNAYTSKLDLSDDFASLLQAGTQFRMKSLNIMLTMRLNTVLGVDANTVDVPTMIARNVRVVIVVAKDEELNSSASIWQSGQSGAVGYMPNLDTIYPPYRDNPGITYRIVYDKTFRVRGGFTTQALIRVPGSVLYDRGIIKFREGTPYVLTNNFMHMFFFADSLLGSQLPGSTASGSLGITIDNKLRWKYYDYGGSAAAAAVAKVNALSAPTTIEPTT